MKVTSKYENIADCRIRIKLEIPPEEMQPIFQQQLKLATQKTKMPGFRVGKVPQKMVLDSYGESIREEVLSKVVSAAYQQVVTDEKLETYGRPHFEEGSYNPNSNFDETFKINVVVARPPSCKIKQLRKVAVTVPTCTVGAADIKMAVEEKLRPFGKMEDATGRLLPLDIVTINISFLKEELQQFSLEGHIFYFDQNGVITSPVYLQSLKEEIEKLEIGKEQKVKHKFPALEDKQYAALSKQKTELVLKITAAKRMAMPPLSEEILKKIGFDSEESMKKQLKEDLEQRVKERLEEKKMRLVVDAIKSNCVFEIPQEAKNYLISHYWRNYLERYVPENQREKTQPPAQWLQEVSVHAEKEIEDELLFSQLAKSEPTMQASNDEVEGELQTMRKKITSDTSLDDAARAKNLEELAQEEAKVRIKEILQKRKVLDFILEKADIKVGKPVTLAEL